MYCNLFVHKFFVILTTLMGERDHKVGIQFQKIKVHPYSTSSPEAQYAGLLTSYDSTFVIKQIKLSDHVKSLHKDTVNTFRVETSKGITEVTPVDCRYYHCRSAMICRDDLELRWRILMCENEFSHISLLLYISAAF